MAHGQEDGSLASFSLKVYDKAKAEVESLISGGFQLATQDSLARDVDAVITVLRTGEVVTEVEYNGARFQQPA